MKTNKNRKSDGQKFPYGVCGKCHKNPAQEEHHCPYNEDVNNDRESRCNCCTECEHECAMDI